MTESTLTIGIRSRLMRLVRTARDWTLARLVAALLFITAAAALAQVLVQLVLPSGHPVAAIAVVIFVHLGYALYVRLIERRRVAELDWNDAPGGLAGGLLTGALLIVGTVAILAATGAYQIGSYRGFDGFYRASAMAVFTAYTEEIVFRGVLFRLVEKVVGTWISLAVSALLFGLIHASNPGAGVWSTAAISIEAGILLAAAFILTRSLWFPIGLHLGWNLVQGGVFGLNVSGIGVAGLFEKTVAGPAWLTGGPFGPEASVVAVILCTLTAIGLLVMAARKRLLVRPRWRRSVTSD